MQKTPHTKKHAHAVKPRKLAAHPRPLIAFMSDLGTVDDSVGICKGLMLSVCPDANIVDICHAMKPFDVEQGSILIVDLPAYFPEHTIFATTTYPATGTSARSVAIRLPTGHTYVAPNNGLLTRVIDDYGYTEAYEVTSTEVIPAEPEPTFFSREMVALPSAHLAAGYPLNQVGRPMKDADIKRIQIPGSSVADGYVHGTITVIDLPYGNVWTSISRCVLLDNGVNLGHPLKILVDGALTFELPLAKTFAEMEYQAPVTYINSRGYLSLALNAGDLAHRYNILRGMKVKVQITPKK